MPSKPDTPRSNSAPPTTERTPAEPVNILLVDDETRNLDVLESILYAPAYRLVRATSANDALLALVHGDFAVLVLDINMPGMNGIELANLIKQRKRTQHIPILFLTAYYQDEKYVLEGYGVGAVDYLTKPVNPVILRSKVSVFAELHVKNRALEFSNRALESEVGRRLAAEEQLREMNQDLEVRVRQRTIELTAANAALQASESQLRLVADHASVYLAHVDRQHRYRYVNRAYATRFNLLPEQVIGATMGDVIGAEAHEVLRPYINRALGGERVEFEAELPYTKSGPQWIQAYYEPERAPDGSVSGLVAVIADVSARKSAEREMARARDEAMAASRAKDDFLAALSHELRTPLSPVLLVASAAAANQALSPEVRADFASIAKNAMLEARLIDDLLDLTRITRGKMTLDLKVADVHTVLEDAIATVRADVDEKELELAAEFGATRCQVLADAARLQQVFWNVLKNAVKFTPARGRIRVVTSTLPEENAISVTFSDSGIGMTGDEIARAFDSFSQGDHATGGGSHRFGGLGLGLAISHMLMKLHAGSIEARSSGRGRGSTFVIRLPLAAASVVPAAAPRNGSAPRASDGKSRPARDRGRLLLVEDHGPTRVALAQLLMQRGFDVSAAGSIAAALGLAQTRQFDVVLSDLGLPDGEGYDLMRTLSGRFNLRGIALSGYGMEHDIAKSRDAGFVGHLTKPVTIDTLEDMIISLRQDLTQRPQESPT